MKIAAIQSTNFTSNADKKRFITDNMRAGIESLLIRMNHSTTVEHSNDHFVSTIITKLKHENGASFEDERRLIKVLPHNEQMSGFSILKYGRTRLDIDNENGEIIDFKKPFYKPWFLVLKKAEDVITDFRNNFYNSCVTQETLKLNSLTPEGEKSIKKMVLNFEKQRLENVTEQLEKELANESK